MNVRRALAAVIAGLFIAGVAPASVFATDPPVASAALVTTLEDQAHSVTVSATDPDGTDITSFDVDSPPTDGSLGSFSSVNCTADAPPVCTATITYTPDPDANGGDSFTFTATDEGPETSAPATATITVTAVNDPPSFTKGANQSVAEDSGAHSVGSWATAISKGPSDESGQTVSFTATNDDPGLFSAQPAVSSAGTLTFTSAANAHGAATVSVHATDSGGTANGGDDTSATQTFTITVTPVNDNPTAVDDTLTVAENAPLTQIDVLANDSDVDGDTLDVTGVTNPPHGSAQDHPTMGVRYAPDAGYSGPDSFDYTISDGNGGTATATVHVTVTPINDPPTANPDTTTVLEDSSANVVDVLANDTTLPDTGETLTVTAVGNPPKGSAAIAGGGDWVTYTPDANLNGSDSFGYTISDGSLTDSSTVAVTITPVNDPPTFTKGANQSVAEDSGAQSVGSWATAISEGPADESGQTVSFLLTNTNNGLFSAQPAVSSAGTLTYTPAANANGSATVSIHAEDDGGTANGGDDSSPTVTFTITVTPVNDPPNAVNDTATVGEDSSASVINVLGNDSDLPDTGETLTVTGVGTATNGTVTLTTGVVRYTPDADYNGSDAFTYTINDGTIGSNDTATVNVTVTPANDPPTAVNDSTIVLEDSGANVVDVLNNDSILPDTGETLEATAVTNPPHGTAAIAGGGDWVTYAPDANYNGSDTFGYTVSDGGLTDSGTVSVTITPVNDPPTFVKGANQTDPEDTGAQSVSGWATAINEGAANESAQNVTFTVTNDDNGLFSVQPAVSPTGTLTYTPEADAWGSATVSVFAKDDGGTADGGDDTSATQTFTITLSPVNDAPSFTAGADEAILEDAGPQSVDDWATDISTGPANESGQVITFDVSADNTALFSVQPAVAADGTLTYTPAADANGSAIVSVFAQDDGGTASGGDDTSPTQTFTITITAVNDAPSFTKGPDVGSAEEAPLQTVTGWATDISPGAADETAQVLAFEVTNNTDTAMFTVQPSIDASGTLTFQPAHNKNGLATITIRIVDDGDTTNGGENTSATQTFTIDVSGTNDPPNAGFDLSTVRLTGGGAIDVLGNDNGGPFETGDPILITSVNEGSRGIVTITGGGTGITYDPIGCSSGTDTFTYTITDGGGLTDTATVLVTISGPSPYPAADGPRPSFVTNSTITSKTSIKMSWCGLVKGTTLKAYRLYQSVNGGSYKTVISSTTSTSSTRSLSVSPTRNQFRAKITDKKGHTGTGTGPLFRVVRTQDSSSSISFSSGWSRTTTGTPSGGSAKTTSGKGKTATFTYTGRAFAIVGTKAPKRGSFNVYLDGVRVTSTAISTKATTKQYRRVLYSRTLAGGTHTIMVVSIGNGRIDLDAILTIATP